MTVRGVWKRWRQFRRMLDRFALPLGIFGLVGLVLYHWRRWQKDNAFLARVKEPPSVPPLKTWPDLPSVSVLVAAWNEADFIQRHIESFLGLRYPQKELVLCAGGSDETYTLAKQYKDSRVKVLEQRPGEGKQRALARSLLATQGEIIFLTDADCLLDDDAFERTVLPIAYRDEEAVTGGSKPLPEQLSNPFVFSQAATQLYSSTHSPAYADGLLGRNCAVTRSLLVRSGALEAEAPTGTDYVTAKELVASGARIRQESASRVFTEYPVTVKQYLKQQRRWLRNVALYGWRYGAWEEVRASLLTSFLGAGMLVWPLTTLLLGPTMLVAWLLFISHAILSRWRYLLFIHHSAHTSTSLHGSVLLMVPFLLLDLVAWSSSLLDYVFPSRRTIW